MQAPAKNGFQFKQFFVAHDRAPMKVTTDSTLLGAWVALHAPKRILDIGTGCGVLALMLAQRLTGQECVIEAIDIDAQAVTQCQQNSQASPFADIKVQHLALQQLCQQAVNRYDLLITNPPYFDSAVACRNLSRQSARYTEQLTHEQLLSCAAQLITESGHLALVLPWQIGNNFLQLAGRQGWYLQRQLQVRYTEAHPFSLLLLDLVRHPTTLQTESLTMRQADHHYTETFRQLMAPFLLRC